MALALLAGLGTGEIVMIVIAIGLLFGATRIPALMRGLGQGIREFKHAVKDDDPAAAPPPPEGSSSGGNPPVA